MNRLTGGFGALALLAGVFLAGALTGAAGMRMWQAETTVESAEQVDRPERRQRDGGRRSHSRSEDRFLKDLTEKLQLEEDQTTRIGALLATSRNVSDSLYGTIAPSMREHLERTRAAVREVLTEEQREGFDAMLESRRRRGRRGSEPGSR